MTTFVHDEAADRCIERNDGPAPCARHPEHPNSTRREDRSHNNGRQNVLTITEKIADAPARRPALGTLRMRLKPAHRSCGFVQGAWWPRSTELASELQSLLAALSLRIGSIDSVLYHESDWSPAPLSIKHQGEVASHFRCKFGLM